MRRNVSRLRSGRRAWCAAAASIAIGLVLSGCGDPEPPRSDLLNRSPGQVYLYGSDGNMMNAIGEMIQQNHPDAITGMKGTMPLTRLSQSFRSRLRQIDPGLVDDTYAGEAYDAVVISALAAQIAGSTDPRAIAAQINGVTVNGEPCDTPAQCLALVKSGRDIRYRGITLQLGGFTDAGEPSASTYGVLRFGPGNQIAESLTQFVPAGNPSTATETAAPAGTGATTTNEPLKFGALLPRTGGLATGGRPMFAGLQLAVNDINEAGGILGRPVEWLDGDTATNPDVAKATAARLIEEGAQVLIGAGASGVSLAVLPVIREAGVVLFSPSNTAARLSTEEDDGLYFRTAPPDGLQAAALADIIVRDGTSKLSIIYRDDAYGVGLAESTKENLVAAGLRADDIILMPYSAENAEAVLAGETGALDFTPFGQQVREADPDGVLIIAFDETALIVDALIKAGITSITN
jgi:hypothetical protein